MRHTCAHCGAIHYENPKLVVNAIAEWEDRILLCKRAIEPCANLWTLPGGFMENGETTEQAAQREAMEEANARIGDTQLYTFMNLAHIHQVHLVYRARLLDLGFFPGEESTEVRLFSEAEIPWEEIAFASVRRSLQLYYADKLNGSFGFHAENLENLRANKQLPA